ncbi:MAG: pyruvate kinase [Bacteroidales bacterium]|nr:pyruvate kinase [Bacteroidales bacterium]
MKKFTKIVATVSDKRCDVDFLRDLADAGMDVVRMNSAHLDFDGFSKIVANVRQVSDSLAIIMDTKGPEIRTTPNVDDAPVAFETGDEVTIEGRPGERTSRERIYVTYPDIAADVPVGAHLLIDDGELDFEVVAVETDVLLARACNSGTLGSRKSVNVPGVSIALPAVSDRDRRNIAYAERLDVDFIAHSFVRSAADVAEVQSVLDTLGSSIKIISKIENQEGVDNFDEILEASYGIMIARGDLGIEVAAERIPGIQTMMIKKCIAAHKPVIVATQMLHTMIEHPRPTRAEVSDVANAVYQRADAMMLSGETAYGIYPVEAVGTMARVAREVEASLRHNVEVPQMQDRRVTSFLSRQAVLSEHSVGTKAILTDSYRGVTARFIASFRGNIPTIAICFNRHVNRWLSLSYGVSAYYYSDATHAGFRHPVQAIKRLVADGMLSPLDRVAYLSGTDNGATSLEIDSLSNLCN